MMEERAAPASLEDFFDKYAEGLYIPGLSY